MASDVMAFQAYRFWAWVSRTFDLATLRRVEESSNATITATPDIKYIGALPPPATLDIEAPE